MYFVLIKSIVKYCNQHRILNILFFVKYIIFAKSILLSVKIYFIKILNYAYRNPEIQVAQFRDFQTNWFKSFIGTNLKILNNFNLYSQYIS